MYNSAARSLLLSRVLCSIYIIGLWAGASCVRAQDVTTWHYNSARTGVQSAETVLTPANVNSAKFGKIFSLPALGDIYAQPLYLRQYPMSDGRLHNVLLVATAEDYVYAFDADGKNPPQGYLWRKLLVNSGETWLTHLDEISEFDIYPNIGIIGTPVVDRAGGTIYVVSRSKTTSGTTKYFQRLHALDIANGAEKLNGPTTIQATVKGLGDGGTTIAFNARFQNQRPALLLTPTPAVGSGRSVFIAWASHGDEGTYHGWVIAYDAANIAIQHGAWVDTPNGQKGGIWMSAGGLSTDGSGNIFLASGNGTFDANRGGSDYGDSALRMTINNSGLALADYFTPGDQASLQNGDRDMGTSAVTLLPPQGGPLPHLGVVSDKAGEIYLLNLNHMGGFVTPGNSSLQSFNVGTIINSSFAFFNNTLYVAPNGLPLEDWTFDTQTERLLATPHSKSGTIYGCHCPGAGATPSISANGTANGIVWALDNISYGAHPAILHAYNAANLATELYNSTQAANNRDAAAIAVKFTTPTIADGKVYVGGRNAVTVYGLRSTGAPLTATPVFSPVGGTYSAAQTVKITDSTPNASIYYTTNGATPSAGIHTVCRPHRYREIGDAPGHRYRSGLCRERDRVSQLHHRTHPHVRRTQRSGHACVQASERLDCRSAGAVPAAATVTGTISRMEVWVDGVKKFSSSNSRTLSTSLSLAAGAHRFAFYAVNTAGTNWMQTVNATVHWQPGRPQKN